MGNTINLIYPVTSHTDHVGPGTTFVAIKGMKEDGVNYILEALKRGAQKIVVEHNTVLSQDILHAITEHKAELISVSNTRLALAQLSAEALDFPAKKLRILGITGTKGKTTSAFLLEHILKSLGYRTALLSTVKNRILDQEFETNLTTRQPDYLHMFFQLCVEHKIDFVVIEVAAQATTLQRVAGIDFDGLIFTNFSQEHAEFYQTLDDYFNAKVNLFKQLKSHAPAIINTDDARIASFADTLNNNISFGLTSGNIRAEILSSNLSGLKLQIILEDRSSLLLEVPALVGQFNVYNILGVVALIHNLGLDIKDLAQALYTFSGVPGRLQRFELTNQARAFIDYAHNPSSYHAVLSTLRPLSQDLIVVFGAGGDRDASKRPLMGKIAAQMADKIIITSDNPRSENPEDIAQQILAGVTPENKTKITIELDREQAIRKAYLLSGSQSMIILLGKGPDEYQIVKGVKSYFSEAAILRSL